MESPVRWEFTADKRFFQAGVSDSNIFSLDFSLEHMYN